MCRTWHIIRRWLRTLAIFGTESKSATQWSADRATQCHWHENRVGRKSRTDGRETMRYRSINPVIWFPVASLLLLAIAFWPRNERATEKPNKVFDHKDISNEAPKVLCVIGVQTGFPKAGASPQYNYALRRTALRSSWFPSSKSALDDLHKKQGVVVRFIIGHTSNRLDEAALAAEDREFGGFLRLPIEEGYMSLPSKTVSFLKLATKLFTAEYIVKIDDDVYLRVGNLVLATQQWKRLHADYVGCMKNGDVYSDPNMRWFERQWPLLGKTYFTHAWGTLYVLSGSVAAHLSSVPDGLLRFFGNEDVTIGAWMLAFNVTHFDDRRLCQTSCTASSIGVYDMPQCAGLCDPLSSLPALHTSASCKTSGQATLPMLQPYFNFVT